MKPMSATYRIQFREEMDFARAVSIVPYLARLGISHLYASPLFVATTGSTHGYDVTDCNAIDPALGGREGFDLLCEALKTHGLGLVLDIVPNHMAASLENAWWRDVIEHGKGSAFARHFDIDWSRRLTLPILDKSFAEGIEAGDIRLAKDAAGREVIACYDQLLPLAPGSFRDATEPLNALHDRQHWQLTHWKEASRDLSYRRFFEVTGLVGLRVEDEVVFQDVHRLTLKLVRSGQVQGLRIDHVDGLADPGAYLRRLRDAVGSDVPIFVEKILEGEETLPGDWPVQGTTGYEFIPALADFLIDAEGVAQLATGFEACLGRPFAAIDQRRAAKRRMVFENFAGELATLCRLAAAAIGAPEQRLAEALGELLIAFPVYRSYATPSAISPGDRELLESVGASAKNHLPEDVDLIDLLVGLLISGEAEEFQRRFQQLSGPIMAKAIEDTLFYRDHRLLALNEVGGEPEDGLSAAPGRGHERLGSHARHHHVNLLATSTHDTKRGEDARARLYALSQDPQRFIAGVARWRAINSRAVAGRDDDRAPRPGVEWMLYQALLGVWPHEADAAAIAELEPRFLGFVEKALREAKLRTDWSEPDEDYEAAVADYAQHLLSPSNTAFFHDFDRTTRPLRNAGRLGSLAQLMIKLAGPGIPDIYQGTEGWDFSLVDPDNRRAPDFDTLAASLDTGPLTAGDWMRDDIKQRLIGRVLTCRKGRETLFASGAYRELAVNGPMEAHVIAFVRQHEDGAAVMLAPRLALPLLDAEGRLPAETWRGTRIVLPDAAGWTDILTDRDLPGPGPVDLADLLVSLPVALLVAER